MDGAEAALDESGAQDLRIGQLFLKLESGLESSALVLAAVHPSELFKSQCFDRIEAGCLARGIIAESYSNRS